MPDPSIATAADYADAMITARRAVRTLILLVLILLLVQVAMFFLVRFDVLDVSNASTPPDASATSQPARDWTSLYHYIVGFTAFAGVTLPIVLSFLLLLIVNIMLVGRLIGVARVTSAYIWCLVLVVLLFPWQSFLNHVGLTPDVTTFKLPGVLYTWYEFAHSIEGARFPNEPLSNGILKWARYVGFPLAAIIILLRVLILSGRGMRQAMGEEDITPSADAEV
jgi:hypothetical protein